MPFTTKPPQLPPDLPVTQPRIDLRTGLLTKEAQDHEKKLSQWRKALVAYLVAMAASIP